MRQITFVSFLLFFSFLVFAQNRTTTNYKTDIDFYRSNPVEKVYLHTDRDIYAENDTIWFKAYLVNAHTLTPDRAPLRNLYVELCDQNMNVVARNMLAVVKGSSFGDFVLHQYKLKPGKYNLRAYTGYQTNFSDAFLFWKSILITPVFNHQNGYKTYYDSIQKINDQPKIDSSAQPTDLQFLPEGGKMTTA